MIEDEGLVTVSTCSQAKGLQPQAVVQALVLVQLGTIVMGWGDWCSDVGVGMQA